MARPIIYKPQIYNGTTLYKGDGSVYNGNGVYNGGAGGPIIPPDYELLEKIVITEGAGKGVNINTINDNSNILEIECFIDYSINTPSNNRYIHNIMVGGAIKGYLRYNPSTKKFTGYYNGNTGGNIFTLSQNCEKIIINKNKVYINDVETTWNYSLQSPLSVLSIGSAGTGNASLHFDVYKVTIKDDNNINLFEGYPVKRTLDSATGLYDVISQQFFINTV